MKTPSAYPVLDNRPIDQWKVTELKEELKRRKLTTRGLKEELVRRLDESLRSEMEPEKEEAGNGVKDPESDNIAETVVIEQSGNEAGELGLCSPGNAKDNVGDAGDRMANMGDAGDIMTNVGDAGDVTPNLNDAGNIATSVDKAIDTMTNMNDVGDIPTSVDDAGDTMTNVGDAGDTMTHVDDAGDTMTHVDDAGDTMTNVDDAGDKMMVLDSVQVDDKDSIEQPVDVKGQEEQELGLVSDQPLEVGTFTADDTSSAGLGNVISEALSSENAVDEKGLPDGKLERDGEESRVQEQAEDVKPLHDDSSDSNNQVSEISSSLGFPIKSNSISTDSVSINEKNNLKDNIIADNVKLESDVKPEMVQPSSSELVHDSGKSHPSDVEEPCENKVSVQDTDNNVTNADMSQKNYSADLGSSEKLNLDRSSGDDSMEEDALESKHIDSNYNSEEVVERTEKKEVSTIKEERPIGTMDIDEPEKEKDMNHENNVIDFVSTDKRKLSDQDVVLNNEPAKRQRRWKSESNNVKEPQMSNNPLQMAVEDVPQPAVLKRNLSGFDSTGGANEPPKEREVPPSSKPATDSLRIDRFLRPFTLKAVQELLAKTGSVTSFWMDHIKTHCYVTYSSVEEAMETRNAVYNLQWPPNGGRHLVAEFVDPEEVKARSEKPPQSPATPVSSGPAVPEPSSTFLQPSPRQQSIRQQMAQQPTLPPPPPLSNPPQAREYALPPPPPLNEKVEAPILTLDDLFKKTKATPRIYYLPLSEEQVSATLEARRKDSKR